MENRKNGEQKGTANQKEEVPTETPQKMTKEHVLKEILKLRGEYSRILTKTWETDVLLRKKKRTIKALIKKSNILSMIAQLVPNDNVPYPLPLKLIKQRVKDSVQGGAVIKEHLLKKLLSESKDLKDFFNLELSIKNPQNYDFEIDFICPRPKYFGFMVKGNTMKEAKRAPSKFLSRIAQSKCLMNEIEINDNTTRDNLEQGNRSQLWDVLAVLHPEIIPTVIKYNRLDTFKFLLIHIPDGISVTPFLKLYRSKIGEMHREFYEKTSVGHPVTQYERRDEILKILERYPTKKELLNALEDLERRGVRLGKKKLSIGNVSALVADKSATISADTIKSHHSRTVGKYLRELLKK
jgi:hypothetical protein